MIFLMKSSLCTPINESYENNQTFCEGNKFQWRKCFLQIIIVLFQHLSSLPPLITRSFKKTFTNRSLPKKSSFWDLFFNHLPCVPPLINFAKPVNILFSRDFFSMTKKYLKNMFQFSTSVLRTPTYNYFNKKSCL